jgi:hypothetical protein
LTSGRPPLTPNRAFIAARKAKGMGRMTLAARVRECGREIDKEREPPSLDSVLKCINRVERGEVRRPGGDFYAPAFAAALGVPASELFGEADAATSPARETGFVVTSHQIVPVFVGADRAARLSSEPAFRTADWEWTRLASRQLDHPTGSCTAYVLAWGTVVFHISHQLGLADVAELALWRKNAHDRTFDQATTLLRDLLGDPEAAGPDYVLSAFWVDQPIWSGPELDTAMRLMCVPSVLLDRRLDDDEQLLAKAEVAEKAHLRNGFTHPDIVEFGVSGVSIGCASWSGVVYLPLSPARALQPEEFVSFEVVAQGLWCYSAHILATHDVDHLPDRYGWRFLRTARARLTSAGAVETGQVRMMRDAVLSTSRLTNQLTQAQAILRDPD